MQINTSKFSITIKTALNKKKLYVQYVRPHVEFASPAWSPWSETDKLVIENVQKRAVNVISGLTGTTYEEKCRELGLDTLEDRRNKQDLTQNS